MKKTVGIALAVALLVMLCVCSAQAAGLPNPITERESLDELNELLGCHLQKPAVMGVSDEAFRTIATGGLFDIGEYCFSVNGTQYRYRFCADYNDDISGVWIDGSAAFQGQVREAEYAVGNGMKLMRWANTDGQYVLMVADGGAMDEAQFAGIANEIMLTSMAPEDDTFAPNGGLYEGKYIDAYSQRAVATVVSNGDGSYSITVSWADSAFEVYFWQMDAVFGEDGLLYYNNCVSSYAVYDEDGNETVETLCENGEGFFGVSGNRLYWNGAADESCRECVFEPIA